MRLQSYPVSHSPLQDPTHPLLIFLLPSMTCLVSIDSRQTAMRELVFLVPLISRILGENPARAWARKREGRGCHQIETFLGIGCQIESGGTSAPYHSTRRRVCRMFNDGRGRFRVSETGLPNPRLVSAQFATPSRDACSRLCHHSVHLDTEFCDLYQRPRNAAREYFNINIFTRRRKLTSVVLKNVF